MAQQLSSASLDWSKLSFDVTETAGRAEMVWKDGVWGPLTFERDPYLRLHMFANVLHYGQEAFEGLKAFHCPDGQVRIFNDGANHERMTRSCRRMMIPFVDYEMFTAAVDMAIRNNSAYIPPPDASGASLYLRPVIFGSGPQVSLHPSKEFIFMVMVVPVGPYFKDGFKAIPGEVISDFDRAAPQGVGACKCAGNYAADMMPASEHKKRGFPIGLYLDAVEKRYVEEFNGANLIAITRSGKYVTPASPSILASITNACLMQIAKDQGIEVENRRMDFKAEVEDWTEVGAVGTAAVVCPIKSLTQGGITWNFDEEAKVLESLFLRLTRIQRGEEPDKYGWARVVALE
eukprot:CAMPEP_0194480358 /NCGR_PEP_ID=MMETSP0253-20130528/3181_1 /TAXON_ID=2966 /ORGANISM="Noctiluca scintillans" /LENGTH=345 /DNA_ID=CAMNT_0039319727 /DNA_START=60 /DNA_END=1097 /DNA_ORIENTATION=-